MVHPPHPRTRKPRCNSGVDAVLPDEPIAARGNQQKLTATPAGTSGVYTLRSVASGLCVDVNGAANADGGTGPAMDLPGLTQPAGALRPGVTDG